MELGLILRIVMAICTVVAFVSFVWKKEVNAAVWALYCLIWVITSLEPYL